MSALYLPPFYEKVHNTIEVCLKDIDSTGGLSDSPALPYLYDSIDGFFVIAHAILNAMEINEPDLDYSILRTIEILTQDLQGRGPENKALMKWVKSKMFTEDVSAGRVRQKRSAAVSHTSQWIKVKLGLIPPIDDTLEHSARVKLLQILSFPIVKLASTTCLLRSDEGNNNVKHLVVMRNMLMVLSELRALASTRGTIRDIIMLQIRRGITDNFLAAGKSPQVVNDAISAIVNLYQDFPDAELKKTIEEILGTREQMLTYLSVHQEQP